MNNKTILYYTANQENPEFEEKIQQNILENCNGLPIISVSQKPIMFGENICVGEVGRSYLNLYRQTLLGALAAKTEYLVFAESDFLYSKEYFSFTPQGDNMYRYENVWLMFADKRFGFKYYKKSYAGGVLIVKRDFLIKELNKYLEGQPEWIDGDFIVRDKKGNPRVDYTDIKNFPEKFVSFSSEIPCISFKTGNGLTSRASVNKERADTLPYWGNGRELYFKML